jgi:hypothetical protein
MKLTHLLWVALLVALVIYGITNGDVLPLLSWDN